VRTPIGKYGGGLASVPPCDLAAKVVREAVSRSGVEPDQVGHAGVEPRIMGMGPVPATRKVLDRTGIKVDEIDVFEVNEAFAVQALAVARELELPAERTNPERQRDLPRSPRRRHRRHPGRQGPVRAQAHRRPVRPGHHVHRRRPGHRGDLRAGLMHRGRAGHGRDG
jgi:Thiolase, C-terminal domain